MPLSLPPSEHDAEKSDATARTKHNNIDKDELVYKTGISSISLYSYMIGKTTPSLYNATKIVRVLGCTLTDFQVMA